MQPSSPPRFLPALDDDIRAFRAVLARSKRIVVLAGAGLSAASGLTTWRGNTGPSWRNHNVLRLSTKAAFIDNPSRIWQYNHYLRTTMLKASPNAAHEALARLALPRLRRELAPQSSSFTLITQNIDGLDRRAIDQAYKDAGLPSPLSTSAAQDTSPNASPAKRSASEDQGGPLLLEMHGHVAGVLCTDYECKHRTLNFATPLCRSLAGTELIVDAPTRRPPPMPNKPEHKRTASEARAWAEAQLAGIPHEMDSDGEPDIAVPDLPRCARCGSLLRPDTVWLTEVPHRIEEVVRVVAGADVIMVVGTSAVGHPAATFAAKVKERGGTVAIFNVERSDGDELADFVFLGPCEEILPKVLDISSK